MTPKIDRFLAEKNPLTPCLVLDLDVVQANYERLKSALPLADIYYAVKANPAPEIIETLNGIGSYFDAASTYEIDSCIDLGVAPEKISYGSTIKKASEIERAFQCGVRLFAFDSLEELEKLARHAPGSKVYCRLQASDKGAEWPLSKKFGCDIGMAKDLLIKSRELKLEPYGVSFHVGSQQRDAKQWEVAIMKAAMVFTDLRDAGIELKMINLGGGFPAQYRDEIPEFAEYADTISKALTDAFANNIPHVIVEPGRMIAAEAGLIQTEVVLVSKKSYDDPVRWVYLDVGMFSGMTETLDESIKYPIRTEHDGEPEGPVVIAGPTCDGIDVLYENAGFTLPESLQTGDRIQILSTGAYTVSYSSVGFNGFPPLKAYYI
ncbi:MAG: type III PLP-dependent enzyme [Rhodospirillaceae bacterium]|jgi:ornithine decarboxylase